MKKPFSSANWGCYAINFLLFAASVFYFFQGARKLEEAKTLMTSKSSRDHIPLDQLLAGDIESSIDTLSTKKDKIISNKAVKGDKNSNERDPDEEYAGFYESLDAKTCTDPIWCNVRMPAKSYYKFDPPTDKNRWKKAQILAASGEQILLKRILRHFPHPLDFLDGDRSFRRIHALVDVFVDKAIGLDDLKKSKRNRVDNLGIYEGKRVVPLAYNFRDFDRAPLLSIGYTVFERDFNEYFSGNRLGYSGIDRGDFLNRWRSIQHEIDTPFMAMCQGNENWGWLSTMFPNRTAKWGACCNKPADMVLYDFLEDKNTLMLIINQHSNVSHPKILNIPRGLPLTWEHTERLVWDAMRISADSKKEVLLFAAASNWGPSKLSTEFNTIISYIERVRIFIMCICFMSVCSCTVAPSRVNSNIALILWFLGPQILKCISAKMDPKDFSGHSEAPPAEDKEAMKTDRVLYYRKLASTRFGLALPGLGYDCFR